MNIVKKYLADWESYEQMRMWDRCHWLPVAIPPPVESVRDALLLRGELYNAIQWMCNHWHLDAARALLDCRPPCHGLDRDVRVHLSPAA